MPTRQVTQMAKVADEIQRRIQIDRITAATFPHLAKKSDRDNILRSLEKSEPKKIISGDAAWEYLRQRRMRERNG